jgi:hypothetical protein
LRIDEDEDEDDDVMPDSTTALMLVEATAAGLGNRTTTDNTTAGNKTTSTSTASSAKAGVGAGLAAAVSATKKKNVNNSYGEDDRSVLSASTTATMATEVLSLSSDSLCWALYFPKKSNSNSNNNNKRSKGIWWPALRFSSILDFLKVKGDDFYDDSSNSSKKMKKKMKNKKQKMECRAMKEALQDNPIETIHYLGRPVDEYVTADQAINKGIEIQDYSDGMSSFLGSMKKTYFPRKFITAVDGVESDFKAAVAFKLFQDFYKAIDEAIAIYRGGDDDDDDSDDDDDEEVVQWASTAQKVWDEYQNRSISSGVGSSQEDDDDAVVPVNNHQQEEEEYHQEDEEEHQQGDDFSLAHSTAAVSLYTEASLTSASASRHQQQTPSVGGGGGEEDASTSSPSLPTKLSNLNIGEDGDDGDDNDFESIWNIHQMEGWEQFENDNDQLVYQAPNGYTFNSHHSFCEYLTETYGWEDPNADTHQQQQQQQAVSSRTSSSSSSSRGRDQDRSSPKRLTRRQRSISPTGKKRWSDLWLYLDKTLGWSYNYATGDDLKWHGASTIWFRPGFNTKERGNLGTDHFFNEDDVLAYCNENDISPPPPTPDTEEEESPLSPEEKMEKEMETKKEVDRYPNGTRIMKQFKNGWYDGIIKSYSKSRGYYSIKYYDGETEEFDYDDVKQWLKDDDDDEEMDDNDDSSGYETPDDQSTVPQDPGKPRLPSPSESTTTSGVSNETNSLYGGGESYCEEDRYNFKILWDRLKDKGWDWQKPSNKFDDFWYCKPASMRPKSDWVKGLDYFCTQEEVIAFCKERDGASSRDKDDAGRNKLDDAPSKNTKKKPGKKKKGSLSDNVDVDEENNDEPSNKKRKNGKKNPSTKAVKGKKSHVSNDNVTVVDGNNRKQSDPKKRRKEMESTSTGAAADVKSNKKQKGTLIAPKKAKLSDLCNDENLKINDGKVDTPWNVDTPKYEHKLCLTATGMSYTNYYYLLGENPKDFTKRFSSVEEIAQHFARTNEYTLSSGSKVPKTDVELSFVRLIRYALVPGTLSTWKEIRKINRSETSYLLSKLGYSRTDVGGWNTPDALVVAKVLEPHYESLDSLCEVLRCLDDLHVPSSSSSRRRKQEISISQTQLIALRLRIAEGFTVLDIDKESNGADYENEEEEEEEQVSIEKSLHSVNPVPVPLTIPLTKKGSNEAMKATRISNDTSIESKKRKRTSKEIEDEKRSEEVEAQIALSPTKIKVGQFLKNPEDNTAPWALKNPTSTPSMGWSKFYYKIGCSYSGGNYYLPGESCNKGFTIRFSSTNEMAVHFCTEGEYSKYLNPLNEEDQRFIKRLFDYGHVPGNHFEWKQLRELKLREVILILDLLGFQKGPDRWWSIPKGLPVLDQKKKYRSLSDLGKALIRVPDLEDRTGGTGNRRRARKGEMFLTNKQMVALRLRIAEGLENEDGYEPPIETETVSDNTSNEEKDEPPSDEDSDSDVGNDEESTMTEEVVMKLFVYDVCSHTDAWAYLQDLGCSYKGNHYHLPGNSKTAIECQNELVPYILEHSVDMLDWENCSLKPFQVEQLVRYLKGFTARLCLSDASLVGQAFHEITKANIRNFLKKIGITRKTGGKYYIGKNKHDESSIVNMIRSTDDLYSLSQNDLTPSKRHRSGDPTLSSLESAAVRLWAVQSDIPLTNMPDLSTIGRSTNAEVMRKATDVENELVESEEQSDTDEFHECKQMNDDSQIETSDMVEDQSSTLDKNKASKDAKSGEDRLEENDGVHASEIEDTKQHPSQPPYSIDEDAETNVVVTKENAIVNLMTPPPSKDRSGANIATTVQEQDTSSLDDQNDDEAQMGKNETDLLEPATNNNDDDDDDDDDDNNNNTRSSSPGNGENNKGTWGLLTQPPCDDDDDDDEDEDDHDDDHNGVDLDMSEPAKLDSPSSSNIHPSSDAISMLSPPPQPAAAQNLNERRTEQRGNRTPLFTQEDDESFDIDDFIHFSD